jgi:thioredoxin 1
MPKNIIDITDNTFESEVMNETKAVLVDFWASWCGPCLALAPVLEKIAEELAGRIKFCRLNVDENQKAAADFGILSIPTLIIFKDRKEVTRIIGALGEKELVKRIKEHIV